ncbi:hypothetical protein [Rhizobium phage RHph_X3_9]|nr:hypothetical protein [Rhizobium phage RHph_X3_9]
MGAIRVADGYLTDPYNLRPEDLKLDVLVHSISTLSRFTGHAKYPYSVGQHSINLADFVWRYTLDHSQYRAAVMHDLSEGWFNDMASPVKKENPDYRLAEKKAGTFIAGMLGVREYELNTIDQYDKRIYVNERDALFYAVHDTGMGDNLTALPTKYLKPDAFRERNWRDVREELWDRVVNCFNVRGQPFWRYHEEDRTRSYDPDVRWRLGR